MVKGLIDHCMSQETVVGRLKEKVESTEAELRELMAWKETQIVKLDLTKKLVEESKVQTEVLKKVLMDKEEEVSKSKKQLCQAKEDAIKEYYNSDDLLYELGNSFSDGFDDCLHQVKATFPDLDLSQIFIDTHAKTLTRPANSEDTDELFKEDTTPHAQDDGEIAPREDLVKSTTKENCPLKGDQTVKEKDRGAPIDQQ